MTTQGDFWYINPWTPGDRFRKAREHTGLDQVDFAEVIGASRQTVSNYENDATKRHVNAIVRAWALATGVTAAWLMTGAEPGGPGGGEDAALPSTDRVQVTPRYPAFRFHAA